jgi:Protein of unknown function (DUF3987)
MELINSEPSGKMCLEELKSEIIKLSVSSANSHDNLISKSVDFPEEIFEHLPDFLKNACNVFDNTIDKKVFLISAIGAISGCLPNYKGFYGGSMVESNLFLFISARAAAGKGAMKQAKALVVNIHKFLKRESDKAYKEYCRQKEVYDKNNRQKNSEEMEKPEIPKCEMLLIPANSSSSVITEALDDSNGRGIIFETEADTLASTLSQDWGDFSDSLRKSFHHEMISQMRKGVKGSRITQEIEEPFLSVILSGTPEQILKLIPDVLNGLFSRFAFFNFEYDYRWNNVFVKNPQGYLKDIFNGYAEKLSDLYFLLRNSKVITEFDFTEEQKTKFNKQFGDWQGELYDNNGDDVIATARRLGLINFRISMILTILRQIEAGSLQDKLFCNDTDFDTAMKISEMLKNHAETIYKKFTDKKTAIKTDKLADKLMQKERAKELRTEGKSFSQIAQEVLGSASKKSSVRNMIIS